MQMRTTHRISLSASNGDVEICFDLEKVPMTKEQEVIVRKLFSQSPMAVVADVEHVHNQESGKEGPASQYLSAVEFEKIRKLGVRLGTQGALAAAQCDFCLHCVKLEALPSAAGGVL